MRRDIQCSQAPISFWIPNMNNIHWLYTNAIRSCPSFFRQRHAIKYILTNNSHINFLADNMQITIYPSLLTRPRHVTDQYNPHLTKTACKLQHANYYHLSKYNPHKFYCRLHINRYIETIGVSLKMLSEKKNICPNFLLLLVLILLLMWLKLS